jgi:DNA topoisomerase II
MSCKAWENKTDRDSKGRKVNRRQATLLTRKSLSGPGKRKGNDYNDSEDEFRPTKRVAKAKRPAEPKQVPAKPTAVVPSKTTVDTEDDDDDDVPRPLPKKRAPAKKMKDESESDFDVAEKPAVKKATKIKAGNFDSDSEVEVLPAKGKGKATETLKRKRYQSISVVSPDEVLTPFRDSSDIEEDSTDEYVRPVKKKAAIDDFFGSSGPSKPTTSRKAVMAQKASSSTTARKVSGKVAAAMKKKSPKKKLDSDDELIDYNDSLAPARTTASKRVARAAPKKYIEIPSDSDDGSDKESMFEDD